MELVILVGKDKEGWGQASGLINRGEWEKIVVVKNNDSKDYPTPDGAEEIMINSAEPITEIKKNLMEKLKKKIGDLEVSLSIASGSGKEHMALISALLSLPVGVKLVVFTKNGIEYLS